MLCKMLADAYHNICVVGDSDQSIYRWRGADITNILNFEQDHPEAKTVLLEQNHRSTSNILSTANEVIGNNSGRKPKNLWTDKEGGAKIKVYRADSKHDEAYFVSLEIHKELWTPLRYYSESESNSFEWIVVMDEELQDKPEQIVPMLSKVLQG